MKFFIIAIATTVAFGATIRETQNNEQVKIPIIVSDVENTFHPYFDDKPTKCSNWKIKLNTLNKIDKKWLKEHGGESLILTKDNMIIKIGDDEKNTYLPDKIYKVVKDNDVTIYNQDKLVFKTDYENFSNMMSYADNEYSFLFIPVTIQFYDCN